MTAMCPKCAEDSDVTDSRETEGGVIRRRRRCEVCEHRWTTYEVHVDQYKLLQALDRASGKINGAIDSLKGADHAIRHFADADAAAADGA